MALEKSRRRLPPYISYGTFSSFLDRLQKGIPARIDRSYWSDRLASSTGTQLMGALRFLGLIDASSVPSSRLRLLASAREAKKAEILRQMMMETYSFMLQGSLDLQTATYAQLEETFHHTFELADDVRRKCIKFFVALASDAEVPLSPFITERLRVARNSGPTKTNKATPKKKPARTSRNLVVPQPEPIMQDGLLTKFPVFDPAWSDDVKLKWFETFDEMKFPIFDPTWPDEVKLKWFEGFDQLLKRHAASNGRADKAPSQLQPDINY